MISSILGTVVSSYTRLCGPRATRWHSLSDLAIRQRRVSLMRVGGILCLFFFQAEVGRRDVAVTGVQTCALPICAPVRITRIDDLSLGRQRRESQTEQSSRRERRERLPVGHLPKTFFQDQSSACLHPTQIGRASCRERV